MASSTKVIGKLNNPLVLLLAAGLLAAGVAWVAYIYLQEREASIKSELMAKNQQRAVPKVGVIVPRTDAAVHTVLNNNIFVMRSIEADLVYPDTILADDFPAYEGQKLARSVKKGRPVRLSDLVVPEVSDVASVVPTGRRAMTIDIDNLNSIAQSIRPNNRVDIFLMSKAPKPETGQTETNEANLEQATLFMQNMVILATGKEFMDVSQNSEITSVMARPGEVEGARRGEKNNFNSVTLLVTPAEAARLLVGQKMGTYRVVLRGQKDLDPLQLPTLRASELMPGAIKKREAPTIELIVGGRGDKTLSQLPGVSVTPPAPNARQLLAAAKASGDTAVTNQALAAAAAAAAVAPSPANQPIPALRNRP